MHISHFRVVFLTGNVVYYANASRTTRSVVVFVLICRSVITNSSLSEMENGIPQKNTRVNIMNLATQTIIELSNKVEVSKIVK